MDCSLTLFLYKKNGLVLMKRLIILPPSQKEEIPEINTVLKAQKKNGYVSPLLLHFLISILNQAK